MGLTDRDPLAQLSLPPGFRFYPTDEELLVQYLCRKVAGHEFSLQIIGDIDLYKFDPWVLPSKAMFGEKEWYFFSPRDRKYPNGSRPNRVAGSGYWKATGTDKIITTQGRKVGIKKALVFYVGKAPKGRKTNWIMHEYRLSDPPRKNGSSKLDDWVLCRIYNKTSSSASKQELLSSGTDEYMSPSISYRDHSTGAGCAGSPSSSSSHIDQVLESLPEIGQQFSPPRVNSLKTGQGSDDKLGLLQFGSGNLDWASLLGLTAPAVPELNSIMTGGGVSQQQQQVQQGYGNNRHGNDFVVPSLPALRQVDSPPQTFRNLVDDEEVQSGPIFGSWPNGYNLNQNSNVFGQSQSLTSTMDPFIQYPNQSLGYGFRQ